MIAHKLSQIWDTLGLWNLEASTALKIRDPARHVPGVEGVDLHAHGRVSPLMQELWDEAVTADHKHGCSQDLLRAGVQQALR